MWAVHIFIEQGTRAASDPLLSPFLCKPSYTHLRCEYHLQQVQCPENAEAGVQPQPALRDQLYLSWRPNCFNGRLSTGDA